MTLRSEMEKRLGGIVEVEVKGARPEIVWGFLEFTSLDEVAPDVASCVVVEGAPGEPGCTRLVSGKPGVGPDGQPFVATFKEKLLTIDKKDLSFSYEVTESYYGFVGYVAEVKVVDNGGDSRIVWSSEADSFGTWSRDGFFEFLERNAKGIARSIEQVLKEGEV